MRITGHVSGQSVRRVLVTREQNAQGGPAKFGMRLVLEILRSAGTRIDGIRTGLDTCR